MSIEGNDEDSNDEDFLEEDKPRKPVTFDEVNGLAVIGSPIEISSGPNQSTWTRIPCSCSWPWY